VVLVWVGQDENVDRPSPPRHRRAELAQRLIRIGTPVDEHAATAGRHNQDAIALSDVHDDQVQATIWKGRQCRHGQRGTEEEQGAPRPGHRVDEPVQAFSELTNGGLRL